MSALAGCGSKCDHEYSYFISRNSDKRTYIVGDQFDPTGLQVSKKCSKCGDLQKVNFELEVSHTLGLDDKKATITCEGATLEYEFFVKEKYHIACCGDSLTAGHMWPNQAYPVYLSEEDLRNPEVRIRMIGDVTCDIKGSVKSTVRPATHDEPYYDYNPVTEKDEPAFSSDNNITVMAVDTCPNALAMDTSAYFGSMLIQHVFEPLLKGEPSEVINRSMILKEGKLTERFAYLKEFAEGK